MHNQLPKTNYPTPMPPVKEPKNDKTDNIIETLAKTICYLIAYGGGPNLSINEKTIKLNKINKAIEQYRNGKS